MTIYFTGRLMHSENKDPPPQSSLAFLPLLWAHGHHRVVRVLLFLLSLACLMLALFALHGDPHRSASLSEATVHLQD